MDNCSTILKLTVLFLLDFEDGSKPADSKKGPKRSKKSAVQMKKITSKKEANTTKPTVASASRPTKKSSFSTNKRIHVTPFPESETPVRPRKIMKPEEPTNNLNQDAQGKDKALASDKSEGISLSPFFWLREREDEVIGTVETLSEPLSLATPLRHNAPCYSDIKDSEDETPLNTTPNVCFLNIFLFLNFMLTSLKELFLTISYLSCRAKLGFHKFLIVKSSNGPRDLALRSCVLLHRKSRYFCYMRPETITFNQFFLS
jgi:hypothetical protein